MMTQGCGSTQGVIQGHSRGRTHSGTFWFDSCGCIQVNERLYPVWHRLWLCRPTLANVTCFDPAIAKDVLKAIRDTLELNPQIEEEGVVKVASASRIHERPARSQSNNWANRQKPLVREFEICAARPWILSN
jgi:hypothetical protein